MAMVNPFITAEVYDLKAFPSLTSKYGVSTLPKTIINDRLEFVGAAPEEYIVEKILSLNVPS